MRLRALSVAIATLALASCQSSSPGKATSTTTSKKEWVQFQPGDVFDVADAKCRMMAQTQAQGLYAQGSASFVIGAQIGNALGNAIRIEQFYKQCMTISGWKQEMVTRPKNVAAAALPVTVQCVSVSGQLNGKPVTANSSVHVGNGFITLGGTFQGSPRPEQSLPCKRMATGLLCEREFGPIVVTVLTNRDRMIESTVDPKSKRELSKISYQCNASI